MDPHSYPLLEDLVRRECRSLLQYVSEAFPWTTPEERGALARVQQMIEEERRGAAGVVRLLLRHHASPPHLGPYPMDFTNINYLSLAHLLPLLADHERRAVADLERDLDNLGDPETRGLVQEILAKKQQHLKTLETMASSHLVGHGA